VFVVGICYMGMVTKGGNFGFLRMLRLLRIIRLLRVWKQLQQILLGLVGGLQASASILGLMAFFFFLYGTMGVYLFSENDPFHFKTLPGAFVSLYSVTNLEWIDIAAINIYGCDSDAAEIYAKVPPPPPLLLLHLLLYLLFHLLLSRGVWA
jgi:voltage-gated sodium channel